MAKKQKLSHSKKAKAKSTKASDASRIAPHFTNGGEKYSPANYPYNLFSWHPVDCEIKGQNGQLVFSQKKVKAPKNWSSRAVEIAASKYFRKGCDKSIGDLIHRVVGAIAKSGSAQGLFATNQEQNIFANELAYILLSQKAAFNSPVWFNVGIFESYKIRGEGEFYYWSAKDKKIRPSHEVYTHPQASACFIQGVGDSLDSIYSLVRNEGRIFKYGSGSGTNFSSLRSHQEQLSQGGTSSGLISFLEFLDKGAAAIKSGGTTRRAAKMVCLDADHPEIENFVEWKSHEEKKAQILIQNGYPADFEGEAYRTVSGQNANNSVRLTNQFFAALKNKKEWNLTSRTTSKVLKKISASMLWQKIAQAAWECAEPGIQFDDTIQSWHTCSASGKINASNPCSEYMFLDDSACNLASLNLVQFFNAEGEFLLADFVQTVRVILTAQEILVDLAGYPTEKIARNSHDFRPLGIGFANLGALLMQLGLPYDSDEGRLLAAHLTALLSGHGYLLSGQWAQKLGPFSAYQKNRKSCLQVIAKHLREVKELPDHVGQDALHSATRAVWQVALAQAKKFGVRNAQISAIAPTGTIGFLMDCETTGIEPEYALVKFKKMVGGGKFHLVNSSVANALKNLNYSQGEIARLIEHVSQYSCFDDCKALRKEHLAIFDCAVSPLPHGRVIAPEAHVKMMAAVQPFVSGAISKTVNLPNSATVDEVKDVFMLAYRLGLKSIAIYRDGCKLSQPLNSTALATDQKTTAVQSCPVCQGMMVQTGGCLSCSNCGLQLSCG